MRTDFLGQEYGVGDIIVYAAMSGLPAGDLKEIVGYFYDS